MKFPVILFAIFYSVVSSAQVVSTIPLFPHADDTVTIIFDATLGNGALADVPPPIFAHTGVVTNYSSSPTGWVNVQGVWGTYDENVLMTEIGDNLYQLKYHMRDFYGVAAEDTIFKMAFVFRNTDGSIVGRAEDGSDIFVDVYEPGLNAAIFSPAYDPYIVELGEVIPIMAAATFVDSIYVYVNDVLIASVEDSIINYEYTTTDYGEGIIRVLAKNGTEFKEDTAYFFVRPPVTMEAVPAGMQQGINYIDDNTVTLVLYAPFKEYIFAVSTFHNWKVSSENYMKVDPDMATFWITLEGLTAGEEYAFQYLIDGSLWVADPLTEKILDPYNDGSINVTTYPENKTYPAGVTTGIVSVFQTAQPEYVWSVPEFTPAPVEDLVIYELLVRDFIAARNYQTLIDTLGYLKTLGVNAIELMPIMEFEGNDSWGYNPSFFIALDKYYGTRTAFKQFVDVCHANGIAVILDIALNHSFGQNPIVRMWWDAALNAPSAESPYFNTVPTHDYNVGYDFNHESEATRNFRNRVFTYWLEEYNIDGYRFDLSKGYTQNNTLGDVGAWGAYDASRIAIWKEIYDTLKNVESDALLILEHFADNSEEKELANYGFLLWGNLNHNYSEAAMGWGTAAGNSSLYWASYKNRGWDDPHAVVYMESHDEERLMYKNLTFGNTTNPYHNCKDPLIALSRMEQAATFLFTIPGPKMIWQFGELGYDYSINFGCRVCAKPVRWDYFEEPNRFRLYSVYAALANLKTSYDVFSTDDFTLSVTGPIKRINLNHDAMNVTVLGNFQVTAGAVMPNFQHEGWWYDYFTGDSINVTTTTAEIDLAPGEYRLYTDVRLTTPDIPASAFDIIATKENGVTIYPNPASDHVHIEIESINTSDAILEVYDLKGAKLLINTEAMLHNGVTGFYVDLKTSALLPGMYITKITAEGKTYTAKFVVE